MTCGKCCRVAEGWNPSATRKKLPGPEVKTLWPWK